MTSRWNRRSIFLVAAGAAVALGLTACNALTTFNSLVPKDSGTRQAVRDVAYGTNSRQRLDVYRPSGTGGNLPVIVFFYGGSWNSGSKDGYAWLGRALASRGFVVVIPDYRLYPEVRFPAFVEDGAAATRWAIANTRSYGGDPKRIVVAGHSAGAHTAAMLALDPQWLGKDRSSVRGFAGLAGPYDFLPFDGPITRRTFGSYPDLPATQPLTFAGSGDPPAFLATGAEDGTVKAKNSDNLARKLRAAGVPVERVTYPGLGHIGILTAIAKPFRGRASVLDDVAGFARRVTE